MVTYNNFLISPIKKRVIFVKKILNYLGYNLEDSFKEDKSYKKALKNYQISKGITANCVIDIKTFENLIKDCPNSNAIWKELKK